MQIRYRISKSPIELEVIEEVRVPWEHSKVIAFQGYSEEVVHEEPHLLMAVGYHLGVYQGFVAGMATILSPPQGLFPSPETLLARLFPDLKDNWHHPSGTIIPFDRSLVYQVPDGSIGAGMILVRNVPELCWGTGRPPTSNAERQVIARRRAVSVLGEMGFEPGGPPAR